MMIRVAIIVGSAKPGAKTDAIAAWLDGMAAGRTDVKFELVDIADFNLSPPRSARYDAYVFVTPARDSPGLSAVRRAVGLLYRFWS